MSSRKNSRQFVFVGIVALTILIGLLNLSRVHASYYRAGSYTCAKVICIGRKANEEYDGFVFNGTVMEFRTFRTVAVKSWSGGYYYATEGLSNWTAFTGRYYRMADFRVTQ